ncbi:hypothetical protein GGR54DRAFT_492301 [Hypoxylon sp. NC1633]|nr:hypothetical protein GGR54DRAFT_492301 [Hypoxylon sp. NC1633]
MRLALEFSLLATALPFALGETPKCNSALGSGLDSSLAMAALLSAFINTRFYGGDAPVVFGSATSNDITVEASYSCRGDANPPSITGEYLQNLLTQIEKGCPNQSGSIEDANNCGVGLVVTRQSDCLDRVRAVTPVATANQPKPDRAYCEFDACTSTDCPNRSALARRRLLGRAPTATPADIHLNVDSSQITDRIEFSSPQSWPAGEVDWWQHVKPLLWTDGSHHGLDPTLPANDQGIPSSRFVAFDNSAFDTTVTGAGPVWGCTILAVVTPRGAYTAHFWEVPYFTRTDNNGIPHWARFPEVLNFIQNGYPTQNYPGLLELMQPGREFADIRTFINNGQAYLALMTPAAPGSNAPRYPNQVTQIRATAATALGVDPRNFRIRTYTVDTGISFWHATDNNNGFYYTDRSGRFANQPWRGYMAIIRRPDMTWLPGQTPGYQVFIENTQDFQVTYQNP